MEKFLQLIVIALSAAFAENVILARGIYNVTSEYDNRLFNAVNYGVVCVYISTLASVTAYISIIMGLKFGLTSYTVPALAIALYCAAAIPSSMAYNEYIRHMDSRFIEIKETLFFGFLPIAVTIIILNAQMNFWESIFYGFGTGVGVLIALLLSYALKRRLADSEVPIAFKGMPIMLLSMGILSLALFGFLGRSAAL